ncbi:MAG: threonyl-tRNA synthetase editing domain-containing protein [Candidatus Thorarchaeota archaeon]
MRLLMFHVKEFWYSPHIVDDTTVTVETQLDESILVWIQAEVKDEGDRTTVLRKTVKNIRWLCKKADCSSVILHSFAHLGESKSEPDFANDLIEETAQRLVDREFDVHIVPFGKFYQFKMHVMSPSLAKVFKVF